MAVGALLAFLAIGFLPILEEPLRNSWIFGSIFCAVLIAKLYQKKISLIAGVLVGYMLAYSCTLYSLPWVFLPNFGEPTINSFGSVVAGHALFLIMVTLPFVLLNIHGPLLKAFAYFAPINAIVMVYHHFFLVPGEHVGYPAIGALANSTMDSCFLVALIPMIPQYVKRQLVPIFIVIVLCAVVLARSVTANLMLACLCFAFIWPHTRDLKGYRVLALISVLSALAGFLKLHQFKLSTGDGRYWIWKLAWNFMRDHKTWFFGTGPGTFLIYGPALGVDEYKRVYGVIPDHIDGWIWLHNDWFQVLFEYGIPGLILVSLFFCLTLKRLAGNHRASWLLLGAAALAQFPAHLFLSAIFLSALAAQAYIPSKSLWLEPV